MAGGIIPWKASFSLGMHCWGRIRTMYINMALRSYYIDSISLRNARKEKLKASSIWGHIQMNPVGA